MHTPYYNWCKNSIHNCQREISHTSSFVIPSLESAPYCFRSDAILWNHLKYTILHEVRKNNILMNEPTNRVISPNSFIFTYNSILLRNALLSSCFICFRKASFNFSYFLYWVMCSLDISFFRIRNLICYTVKIFIIHNEEQTINVRRMMVKLNLFFLTVKYELIWLIHYLQLNLFLIIYIRIIVFIIINECHCTFLG